MMGFTIEDIMFAYDNAPSKEHRLALWDIGTSISLPFVLTFHRHIMDRHGPIELEGIDESRVRQLKDEYRNGGLLRLGLFFRLCDEHPEHLR